MGSPVNGVVDSTMIDDDHGYQGTIMSHLFIDLCLLIDVNKEQ